MHPGAAGGPDSSALPFFPAGYLSNRPTSDSQPIDLAHGSRHVGPCRLTVLRNIYPTSPCDPRIHETPFGRETRDQIVLRASVGTQGALPSNWRVLGMVTAFRSLANTICSNDPSTYSPPPVSSVSLCESDRVSPITTHSSVCAWANALLNVTLLSCGGQWSKPVEEGFLLRCIFVVGDQPVVANLLEPLQLPFERRIWVSERKRSFLVATVYRGGAQGELLVGEG